MRPPMRNLSPMAEPWGRHVDEQIERLNKTASNISVTTGNEGSVQNSAMDNLAIQIRELSQRRIQNVSLSDMETAVFTSGSSSPVVSQSVYLPKPADFSRIGILSIQGAMTLNGTALSAGYVDFIVDGVRVGQGSDALPPSESAPDGWDNSVQIAYASVIVGPGSNGVLTVNLQGRGLFEAGNRSVKFSNIRATIQYGQRA